jgi:hypothetical protein
VVKGEVDAVETLAAAGVKRARLVLANAKDTVNANIALTVRELSKSVETAAHAAARRAPGEPGKRRKHPGQRDRALP